MAFDDAIIHRDRAIVAMKVGTNVAARIRKMHPDGLREFDVIRGNYRKPSGRPINQDIIPRRSAIEKRGREFWDCAPRSAFVRQGRRQVHDGAILPIRTHLKPSPPIARYATASIPHEDQTHERRHTEGHPLDCPAVEGR